MRILVTGSAGQIAESLREKGSDHDLIFASRPDFDLTRLETVKRVVLEASPDLVISAAAYTAVDKAEDEPELAWAVNAHAPGVLAAAAAEVGARVLHISTDYVFDGSLDRPWRETDHVNPLGVYGASKLGGEKAVAASGSDFAIVRTAWVYSPFGQNFAKTMLRLAKTRDTISVVEDQVGCPTSALDIADALLRMAEHWAAQGTLRSSVYHIAGASEATWADFARAIFMESARLSGPVAIVEGIPTANYPTKAQRPKNSRLNSQRLYEEAGYRCPPWQSSLSAVVGRLLTPERSGADLP